MKLIFCLSSGRNGILSFQISGTGTATHRPELKRMISNGYLRFTASSDVKDRQKTALQLRSLPKDEPQMAVDNTGVYVRSEHE